MLERLSVSDAALSAAGVTLTSAAHSLVSQNVAAPSGAFDSLTGIDQVVQGFLNGVTVARAALADAAKQTSAAVADLMQSSDELDAYMVRSLYSGFAVPGSGS